MTGGKFDNSKVFETYLKEVGKTPLHEQTELTSRPALKTLLDEFAGAVDASVQHEPKREPGKGAPDFKITRPGVIIGYAENKALGENLDKVLKSGQIERYKSLSDNILLTDYLHFIWMNGDDVQRAALCHATDLENPRFRIKSENAKAVSSLLKGFFSSAPEGIGRAEPLAEALAVRSKLLRTYLSEELVRQESSGAGGRFYGLFKMFREQVFHGLTIDGFADAFAQMLAYGLFLARLNSNGGKVTLHNAREHISGSFDLIRELVDFLTELEGDNYQDVHWVTDEVLSIVNNLDLAAVQEDLSFRNRPAVSREVRAADEEEHRLFERDPFIYFYENYLAKHAPEIRESRGVYYTPPPVVNFIVRAADDILKDKFKIKDGLADQKNPVKVLDFACGTGTFMLEVFQQIFENIGGADKGRAGPIVHEHILKNIHGFEYLIAPYTIAHLKLSQYLHEQGHPLRDDERLQVLLTNTVEPIDPQANYLLPAVSAEVKAAQDVKETPVLVITGNPPYSGHSKNDGAWITGAIDEYKHIWVEPEGGPKERKPLKERNSKWLQDDYVKFIRFAQMKMDGYSYTVPDANGKTVEHSVEGADRGIVAVITNHSWLDNPTFRGMRQSLMRSFQQIYVLDLHGSVKRREKAPDGSKDENIFDIQQGVAVSMFVKGPGLAPGVWRSDFWGERLEKYRQIYESSLKALEWEKLDVRAPYYLFKELTPDAYYEAQMSIRDDIFVEASLGAITSRDKFAFSFSEKEAKEKLKNLTDSNISDDDLRNMYKLKDNSDWSLEDARIAVRNGEATEPHAVAYRPFDNRWSEYSTVTIDRPRDELIDHVAGKENFCLLAPRQISLPDWRHAFVTNIPAEACLVSTKTKSVSSVFPMFLYSEDGQVRDNFRPEFREFIDGRYGRKCSVEDIFNYIYAVLNCPFYRTRYAEFLRIDFPRIPFPEDIKHFRSLHKMGSNLAQVHLQEQSVSGGLGVYEGKGENAVEYFKYSEAEKSILINKAQKFTNIPQYVWDFHIGDHQVLRQYLKARKGRELVLAEIDQVSAIANIAAFTIKQTEKIDKAYAAAFPDQI